MKNLQESAFALFLLSNCAFGDRLALKADEYGTDLTPISRGMCRVVKEVYDTDFPVFSNLGTYNFIRKQTQSSKLFKQLEPFLSCYYIRKNKTRVIYIDFSHDDKIKIHSLLRRIAAYSELELDELKSSYKKYLIKHMAINELQAHEQLMFFDRVNYRDYLMPQFECL